MIHNGYRIMATMDTRQAWPVTDDGDIVFDEEPVILQEYETQDYLFTVVDSDDYPLQTFETIQECKDYIDEELL